MGRRPFAAGLGARDAGAALPVDTDGRPSFRCDDERDAWEERAAIVQYMGGQPRKKAERIATERMFARRQSEDRPVTTSDGGPFSA